MTHSHRRKNSRNQYFRMDVPKDIRHLTGKTSWQHSLDTSDPTLADARRAYHSARYKKEIIRLRAQAAADTKGRADAIVAKAFDNLTAYHGSADRAVAAELESLAWTVRATWSRADAHEVERQIFGQAITDEWDADHGPVDAFPDEHGRSMFKLRAELFETRMDTSGLVNQELARSLLERGPHDPLQFQVACIAHDSDEVDITSKPAFEAIARAYLKRLAGNEFTSWPPHIREALAPIVQTPASAPAVTAAPHPVHASQPEPALGRTLYAAFDLWKVRKGITGADKTADEFATALKRFELLCGTVDISTITPEMVKRFRSLVAQLPFPSRQGHQGARTHRADRDRTQ